MGNKKTKKDHYMLKFYLACIACTVLIICIMFFAMSKFAVDPATYSNPEGDELTIEIKGVYRGNENGLNVEKVEGFYKGEIYNYDILNAPDFNYNLLELNNTYIFRIRIVEALPIICFLNNVSDVNNTVIWSYEG